jgi:hypothetical protein
MHMHNLTTIRMTADRVMDLWVCRLQFLRDEPGEDRLVDFHRLDMRDSQTVEDPFDMWLFMADEVASSLVMRRIHENGR